MIHHTSLALPETISPNPTKSGAEEEMQHTGILQREVMMVMMG